MQYKMDISIKRVTTLHGPDCGTDHNSLIADTKINLKRIQRSKQTTLVVKPYMMLKISDLTTVSDGKLLNLIYSRTIVYIYIYIYIESIDSIFYINNTFTILPFNYIFPIHWI